MNRNFKSNAGNWNTRPLGEIAEVRLDKMLDKAKHRGGAALPYLRNVNVRWGSIETDDMRQMHFEDDELGCFGFGPRMCWFAKAANLVALLFGMDGCQT
jgi:hypothetical protein